METEHRSDEELLERSRSGCEQSFADLYQRHQGRIFRFALGMSGSSSTAEEIAQEVFLTLLDGLDRFDGGRGSLLGYLLGTARNITFGYLRRERLYLPMSEEESAAVAPEPDPCTEMIRGEKAQDVRRVLATLPHAFREVVWLCDVEELDYAQAAQVLGCPIGTVRSRLHRGRALIARKLGAGRPSDSVRCEA